MALYNWVSTTKWTGRQEVRSWVAGLHVSHDRALYCSKTNLPERTHRLGRPAQQKRGWSKRSDEPDVSRKKAWPHSVSGPRPLPGAPVPSSLPSRPALSNVAATAPHQLRYAICREQAQGFQGLNILKSTENSSWLFLHWLPFKWYYLNDNTIIFLYVTKINFKIFLVATLRW